MIANTLFYKFYDDIMTLPILLQTDNTGGLGSSVVNLFDLKVLFLIINLPILLIAKHRLKDESVCKISFFKKYVITMIGAYVMTFSCTYFSGLPILKFTYNREAMVKTLGGLSVWSI